MRKIVLVGNQNTGKTTLFNALTGLKQKVGNFPGVTVESKKGNIKKHKDWELIDLPGVYSLSTFTEEETVTKDYLKKNKIDSIINIVDATNLERNLYLSLQLIDLKIPMVIALNMVDELEKKSLEVNFDLLSEKLGVKVVPLSALKEKGIDQLIEELELTLASISLEKDINQKDVLEPQKDKVLIRYQMIEDILDKCLVYKNKEKRKDFDAILTHRYFGIPIFLLIIGVIFYLTFRLIGPFLNQGLERVIELFIFDVEEFLTLQNVNSILIKLITEGVLSGVGSVLAFIPIIVLLFFFLSLLEDSGYMARVVFLIDSPLRKIGLSGNDFVPLLLGFGCSVPAVLATRTLKSKKEKQRVISLIPFIPCSAKLPIYSFIAVMFFKDKAAYLIFSLYLFGIIATLFVALLKKRSKKEGDDPLILELPPYRFPSLKTSGQLIINRTIEFAKKAFTLIFIASIIVFLLRSFDFGFTYVSDPNLSILAAISKSVAFIFTPLGLGRWEIVASLIVGLSAKEAVVSTLNVVVGTSLISELLSPLSAMSLLVFVALYMPCIATFKMIHKELNSRKEVLFLMLKQNAIAWGITLIFYQVGLVIL